MTRFLFAFFLGLLPAFHAGGQFEADYRARRLWVKVAPDRELYVNWIKAKRGRETVIVLNGLTYSERYWENFAVELAAKGYGVLRYDMFGMGKTLLKYAPIMDVIPYQNQVTELESLIKALKIRGPVNLLGLSYGGGIAMAFAAKNPHWVKHLIAMAPYTQPMESQDRWIRQMIQTTRLTQPWNKASDDALYDFFLRQLVYSTYPAAEPSVLENPFKLEAVFRLAQGVRHWNAEQAVNQLPAGSFHLMIAGNDQYIPRPVMDALWNSVPSHARASAFVVAHSEHKIPEAVPEFAAAWVSEILSGNEIVGQGWTFEGNPYTGVVRYADGEFKILSQVSKNKEPLSVKPKKEVENVLIPATARLRCQDIHKSSL